MNTQEVQANPAPVKSKDFWERRAFEKQLLGIIPDLRAFARFLTGNPTEADDLVQDAVVRALNAYDHFDLDTNIKAWTFTILRNIRINSISPGLTDTPMTAGAKATPGVYEAFLPSYPLGRVGTSDDIAAAAVFLASDECFMTGQNLQVNGGLTLRRNPTREEITASVMAHAGART